MPFQVVEIEETPNPNAVKFNLDGTITIQTESYLSLEDAESQNDLLAAKLFMINGVVGVMFCRDFVTINKKQSVPWSRITSKVEQALADAAREPIQSDS